MVPAPTTSSLAAVVVAAPLLGWALLPPPEEVTSSGLTGSRPEYSATRMSTYGVAALNVTVTVLAPAAMFLA